MKTSLMILSGLFFFSCSDDEGLSFSIQEGVQLEYEELEFDVSSIFIDSLRTDLTSTAIAGEFLNAALGQARAEAYLLFEYDSGVLLTDTLLYNGLVFSLATDDLLKNEDSDELMLQIHNLNQKIFDEVVYKASFDAKKDPNPLDTITIRTSAAGQLSRSSANEFGQILFDLLLAEDSLTFDYQGNIALAPVEDSRSMIAFSPFSDSSYFTIQTRGVESEILYETRFEFIEFFSGIDRELSIDNNQPEDLETFEIADQSRINHLFGVYPLVDLTPLKEFSSQVGEIVVNKAEIITPVVDSENNFEGIQYFFYKPDYGISGEGRYIDPYNTLVLGNESYFPQAVLDLLVGEQVDESYVADVTLFTEFYTRNLLIGDEILTDKLVLVGSDIVTLNEATLTGNVRLRLYYSFPTQ